MLILYGFGAADRIFSESKSLESNQFYSVTGKISKIVENENGIKIHVERAEVRAKDGTAVTTGIVCSSRENSFQKGDEVSFYAKLYRINSPENPGEFHSEHYYASQNIFYQSAPERISVTQKCKNPWINGIFSLKKKLCESYQNIAAPKEAGVCISIVLGDKALLEDELKTLFQENGIAHILAISGLHVSMIGLTLYRLVRRIGLNFSVSAAFSVVVMLSYGVMTGNSISTIRAVIMFGVTVYAEVFGRTYDSISALCLSASVIMLRYPYCIYNAGFYLSFCAVLGIVVIAPAFIQSFSVKNSFLQGLLVSFSVSLATLPILTCFYHEIPVYAPLLNLVILPCMGMLIASALFAGIAGIFCIPLGIFLMGPASFIIRFYEMVCGFAGSLPGSLSITGAPGIWQVLVYEILLYGVALAVPHLKKRAALVSSSAVMAALLVLFLRVDAGMEVVMLAVGQGDCMYLSCEGSHVLIDGGSSSKKNIGKYTIVPFLKYKGVRKLDYVILTHPDSDHYSGLLELVQDGSIKIRNFILPEGESGEEAYQLLKTEVLQAAGKVGTMHAGQQISLGNLRMRCLHPANDGLATVASSNDRSLVFWISYGNFDMITTGDVEHSGEQEIMRNFELRKVEVLKCAHHGSSGASSEEWLQTLRPQITLISCGRKNRYGHPHKETLARLEAVGTAVFRTDECGAVTLKVRDEKIGVEKYLR